MTDLVITWPKTRPLDSYLEECEKAAEAGFVVNYRVANRPDVEIGDRCYVVYDGAVRGWQVIYGCWWRDDVTDPTTGRLMKPGYYVVRDPAWNPIEPIPMKGFQGFRYFREAQ